MSVTLDDIRRVLRRPAVGWQPSDGEGAVRHAAVAAIVLPNLELLFMRRAEFAGDPWSGHVSFPGGRVEPDDASPRDAAIRETREEVGVDLAGAELLGELDVVAPISGLARMAIHPFVFALDHEPELRLNREVQSVHRAGIDALLRDEGRGPMSHTWRGANVTLPRVDFDGVRLWGLTLRMVDDLLDRLDGQGIGLDRLRRRAS